MKINSLKKKYGFSDENLARIKDAVAKAEKDSYGELAFAITPSSNFYTIWEFIPSFIAGMLSLCVMIPLSEKIGNLIKNIFWTCPSYAVPLFMMAVFCVVVVIFYMIFNTPFFDRLFVPKKVMSSYVQNKALKHFVLSDVYSTKQNSGILIFVSLLERNVQIICDKGILKSTSQEEWDKIASELAVGFSKKNPTDAIIATIEKCGVLFKKNFPLEKGQTDVNELSDGIEFIEGGDL